MPKTILFLSCTIFILLGAIVWKQRKAHPNTPTPVPVATPTPLVTSEAQVSTDSANLFLNPGFEAGKTPWFSMPSWGTEFELSSKMAHTGKNSAHLAFDTAHVASASAVEVHGVVQEVRPQTFPEKISGYYFVEDWQQGVPKQYLQFVVIVFGADNIPEETLVKENFQIRYLLAGTQVPPFEIQNAKFVFLSKDKPVLGRWIYFERNIREDFQREWGVIPKNFSHIRLFFEARWDGREDQGRSAASVYYDDLQIGSSSH